MSAIRQSGRINANTTLIDIGMWGVSGVTAVYLVEGARKKCLIDAGTRTEAAGLVKALKSLNAFPPDIVIVTHPHFDHTQGIPTLKREASRMGKRIDVLASRDAALHMADRNYNNVYDAGPYEVIHDVTLVRDGDTVDLGGITLKIFDIPGHCSGHIAILDEKNRNIFVGDSLGYKVGDHTFLPAFMPPSWDPEAFLSSIDKLKRIEYESLCIAHFGCIHGNEARSILDESASAHDIWWKLYDRNARRLSDLDFMGEEVMREINPGSPDIRIISWKLKLLYRLMTGGRALLGKPPIPLDRLLLSKTLKDLRTGYRIYKNIK